VSQDPAGRFVVAHATGRRDAPLAEAAIARARARTGGRPLQWCSGGRESCPPAPTRAYRQPVRTGRRGRPPLRVPDGLALTQSIKPRDARGRLLGVETRATIGAPVPRPGTSHVERLNGVLRDRLACLTRKTHAFAKAAPAWDAAVGLALFAHNWPGPHPALRQPSTAAGRRYDRRTPAMALGLTDHPWHWPESLTMHALITN
jgi:hypothetical protein